MSTVYVYTIVYTIVYTANPPVSVAVLIQKHFNFLRRLSEGSPYSRVALISKRNEKRAETMSQNLFMEELCKTLLKSLFCLSFFLP